MRTLYTFLLKINILVFITIVYLIIVGINIILIDLPLPDSTNEAEMMKIFEGATPVEFFFLAIIVAPLFETAIFQMVVIFISKAVFNSLKLQHYIFPVAASAFAFGLGHCINLKYFIIATFSGFIYAFSYVLVQKRSENAFFIVALIHSLYNLIPYSQEYIFK